MSEITNNEKFILLKKGSYFTNYFSILSYKDKNAIYLYVIVLLWISLIKETS